MKLTKEQHAEIIEYREIIIDGIKYTDHEITNENMDDNGTWYTVILTDGTKFFSVEVFLARYGYEDYGYESYMQDLEMQEVIKKEKTIWTWEPVELG